MRIRLGRLQAGVAQQLLQSREVALPGQARSERLAQVMGEDAPVEDGIPGGLYVALLAAEDLPSAA